MAAREFTPQEIDALIKKRGYKGPREKFNPHHKKRTGKAPPETKLSEATTSRSDGSTGRRNEPAKEPKKSRAPQKQLPEPTHLAENALKPTELKNDPIWADSIFGIDVTLTEIHKTQTFSPNFARLSELVRTMFTQLLSDDAQLSKKMTVDMLVYYSYTLLWARLLDIKAKRANTILTTTERSYRRKFTELELNVPHPIMIYLKSIGHVVDRRGKRLYLTDHNLPVAASGGKTGYHAAQIDEESHLLFEEIPTLGVIGDVLMAASGPEEDPQINFPILPVNTSATRNLLGNPGNIGPRRSEVRAILNSFDITRNDFHETVPNTRLNMNLVQYMSTLMGESTTFRNDKVDFTKLTQEGSEIQLIVTEPVGEHPPGIRAVNAYVRPLTVSADSKAEVGASYYAGFQLKKPAAANDNQCWSTLDGMQDHPYVIPQEWVQARDARRQLPQNFSDPQFTAIADDQDHRTTVSVRRLVIAKR